MHFTASMLRTKVLSLSSNRRHRLLLSSLVKSQLLVSQVGLLLDGMSISTLVKRKQVIETFALGVSFTA